VGTNADTRGTGFVVYEDIYDAKNAVDHLSGFNVQNRYLIVLYYNKQRLEKKSTQDITLKKQELQKLKEQLERFDQKQKEKEKEQNQ
jgi:pre-mRNA branch site protein p14